MLSRTLRLLFFLGGWICLAIGAIGVVVPGLPTTPLVILAAWCFARSSKRFHHWLLEHRIFGPYISAWEEHGVIPLRVKILATAIMLPMTAYMIFESAAPGWAKVLASALVAWGLVFIWTKPSRPETDTAETDWEDWDRRIERDARSGKLAKLFGESEAEHRAGKSTEL